jgi:hypothetical protein
MERRAFLASAVAFGVMGRYHVVQAAVKPARIGWLTAQRASSLSPFLDHVSSVDDGWPLKTRRTTSGAMCLCLA